MELKILKIYEVTITEKTEKEHHAVDNFQSLECKLIYTSSDEFSEKLVVYALSVLVKNQKNRKISSPGLFISGTKSSACFKLRRSLIDTNKNDSVDVLAGPSAKYENIPLLGWY